MIKLVAMIQAELEQYSSTQTPASGVIELDHLGQA
ncbi:MAG: hypothetical protein ACI8UO_003001 [Verrucomicrobiales bacterium]